MALNSKQLRFCDEYLLDHNASRAAVTAGYSQKTANRIGSKLLTKVDILEYVRERKEKLAAESNISLAMITEAYRRLAFYDPRKFYNEKGELKNIQDIDEENAFALIGFEAEAGKIKTSDRRGALDSLCKVLGYFAPDKVANTTTDGKDIIPQKTLTDRQFSKLITAMNEAATR